MLTTSLGSDDRSEDEKQRTEPMTTLDDLRDETDGTLPAYAWPGGYPMHYITEGGLIVCPKCANDPDTSDPVVAGEVYWEGPDLICDDGGETIPSAYGDPDEPEPEPEHTDPCEPIERQIRQAAPHASREVLERVARGETADAPNAELRERVAREELARRDREEATSAAWTPERGWHDVTETERKEMQRETVGRLLSPYVRRAQAGLLPVKELGR